MIDNEYLPATFLMPLGLHPSEEGDRLEVDEITPEIMEELRVLTAALVKERRSLVTSLTREVEAPSQLMDALVAELASEGMTKDAKAILAKAFVEFPFFVSITEIAKGSGHIDWDKADRVETGGAS